jgi:hypothetical protein
MGHKLSIDTFVVASAVDFVVYQRNFPRDAVRFTSSSGPLVNLGSGSWLYAATAYGLYNGKPASGAWSFEYKADEDRIATQIYGRSKNYFYGVSKADSPIQLRRDVSGLPTVIIINEMIYLENQVGDFAYVATGGSYIAFDK